MMALKAQNLGPFINYAPGNRRNARCITTAVPLNSPLTASYHLFLSSSSCPDFLNKVSLFISLVLSVQFSCSVVSDSLWPHEPQHASPPCLSPAPRVHPNPCASSRWCHPTISSSVVPFSCPQSFPASGSFPMSQLFGTSSLPHANTSVYLILVSSL